MKNFSSTMNYDQKIDSLAREVNVAYICISVIRELIKQSEENLDIFKEYDEFFYHVHQTSYERLYTTLSRLQDNTKSTISIFKVIAKSSLNENERKKLEQKIKDADVFGKIKSFRDNFLSHYNERLALDENLRKSFLEKNKPTLDDIEAHVYLLGEIIKDLSQDASFQPLTIPQSSIRSQINSIFQHLSSIKNLKL